MKSILTAQVNYGVQTAYEQRISSKVPNVMSNPQKIDAFRHDRVYDMLGPIYKNYARLDWITVGDSGADAFSIKNRGVKDVVSTSLTDVRLNQIKSTGYLNDIPVRSMNAESTGEADDSHGIVYCKEAYHHFPRAPLALYELLRITKQAVVFIEPVATTKFYPLDELRVLTKKIFRKQSTEMQSFEPAGNYIYKFSVPEITQMATGLELPYVAYKYFNNFFMMKICDQPMTNKLASLLFKAGIGVQNCLSRTKLMSWGLVSCVVFKESPTEDVLDALRSDGYIIKKIPTNPYTKVEGVES